MAMSELMRTEQFGPLGDNKYREYAGSIHAGAAHALDVLSVTLDASLDINAPAAAEDHTTAPASGTITPDECHADQCLTGCLRLIAPKAAESGITIASNLNAGTTRLRANPVLLHQILINLLANAIKFTPPQGAITACSENTGIGGFTITIADTGVGIAASDLATPSGLGLNMVRKLSQVVGATFAIESTRGGGTTVSLSFPPCRIIR